MEKQRIKRYVKSGKRLLIAAFLFCQIFYIKSNNSQLYAQTAAPVKIYPAENQKLYPKQDIKYEILIPKAKPGNVQLQTQNLPAGIELKTLRKTEYFTEEGGTLLELWYRFEKKGSYTIPRITVMVNGRRRYFNFERITIEEDPANMLPRIVIQFENGKTVYSDSPVSTDAIFEQPVGTPIKFRVNLQYSTQLIGLNWEIPQNSIFKQTETYEFTEIKYREKNYSNELIPVADFEWTALAKGPSTLPKIKLSATAYKGYRSELTSPGYVINFVQNTENEQQNKQEDSIFEDAFDTSYSDMFQAVTNRITLDDCYQIAELRMTERHNPFIYTKTKKLRVKLEQSLGLPSEQGEFCLAVIYFCSFVATIVLVFFIIFLKKRRTIGVIVTSVLLTCTIAINAYSYSRASKQYAISLGCSLSSIPEDYSNSVSEISMGNRVHITEKTSNWYYVELGTISGWCKKDQVILIK